MTGKTCGCGTKYDSDDPLCPACMRKALREIAKEVAKRKGNGKK